MRHKPVAGTQLQAARGRPIRYELPHSRWTKFRQEAHTSFPSSSHSWLTRMAQQEDKSCRKRSVGLRSTSDRNQPS